MEEEVEGKGFLVEVKRQDLLPPLYCHVVDKGISLVFSVLVCVVVTLLSVYVFRKGETQSSSSAARKEVSPKATPATTSGVAKTVGLW